MGVSIKWGTMVFESVFHVDAGMYSKLSGQIEMTGLFLSEEPRKNVEPSEGCICLFITLVHIQHD